MSTSSLNRIAAVLAIACTTCFFTGCAALGVVALASAPVAINIAKHLPGDMEVVISKPTKIDINILREMKSLVTNSEYAVDHLENANLFGRVSLTKVNPTSLSSAAKFARGKGHAGFMLVDILGASQKGFLDSKFVYQSARVTIISATGTVVYEQTVSLEVPISSVPQISDREVAEILANSLIADLKQTMASSTSLVATKPKV